MMIENVAILPIRSIKWSQMVLNEKERKKTTAFCSAAGKKINRGKRALFIKWVFVVAFVVAAASALFFFFLGWDAQVYIHAFHRKSPCVRMYRFLECVRWLLWSMVVWKEAKFPSLYWNSCFINVSLSLAASFLWWICLLSFCWYHFFCVDASHRFSLTFSTKLSISTTHTDRVCLRERVRERDIEIHFKLNTNIFEDIVMFKLFCPV